MNSQRSGDRQSCLLPITLALIGATATILAAVLSNPAILDRLLATIERPAAVVSQSPDSQAPDPTSDSQPVPDESPEELASEAPDPSGCVVTISHPLVALKSEPDTFSQDIISVPPGEYSTLDYTQVTVVDQLQGWFQIEAEGRSGWIRNDTWTISDKTSDCP